MQILINTLISFSPVLVIAFSFNTIYQTTKFFHIAHAVIITCSAYLTYLFSIQLGFNIFLSFLCSIIGSLLLTFALERLIYNPLRKKNISSWKLLIASLGIYVIIQNLISIIWGNDTKSIRTWPVKTGHKIYDGYITDVQIAIIIVSLVLFFATVIFLKSTTLGKKIRAVSSNPLLSNIFGISSDRVILCSFMIGSLLAAISGILISLDVDMTPTMGFHFFFYAVVAMIIGGVGSYKGLFFGSFLLAVLQNLTAYFLGDKWMDASVYIILILFLICKPFGFSGKHLKKVEI